MERSARRWKAYSPTVHSSPIEAHILSTVPGKRAVRWSVKKASSAFRLRTIRRQATASFTEFRPTILDLRHILFRMPVTTCLSATVWYTENEQISLKTWNCIHFEKILWETLTWCHLLSFLIGIQLLLVQSNLVFHFALLSKLLIVQKSQEYI